jgi:FkbM family methyltransferase
MRGFMASDEFRRHYYGVSQREDGRIVLVRDGTLRIAVDPFDMVIGWKIINGSYEHHVRWLIESIVKPGNHCVDLGANAGYFTAQIARQAGPEGRVYAYEPFPLVRRLLCMTIQESGLSGTVRVRESACSDTEGESTLYFPAESDHYGGAFVMTAEKPDLPLQPHAIRTTYLDLDLRDEPPVQFMKIDVEGSELRALHGARKRLERDRPAIVMELSAETLARQNHSPEDVLEFLAELGYECYSADSLYAGTIAHVAPGAGRVPCADILALSRDGAAAIVEELAWSAPTRPE